MRKNKIRNLFVSAALIAGSASPAYAAGKPVIKKSKSKNKKLKKKVIKKENLKIKSKKRAKKITVKNSDVLYDQTSYIKNYNRENADFIAAHIMNWENDIDISSLNIYISLKNPQKSLDTGQLRKIYNLMLITHPEIIQTDGSYQITYNTGTGLITHLMPKYILKPEEYDEAVRKVNAEISKIVKQANKVKKKKGTKKAVIKVNDLLKKKISYDTNAKYGVNAYGALIKRKAYCMGYSRAFSMCMTKMKIKCLYEMKKDGTHIWNRVRIGNKWLVVDVTANDEDPLEENLLSEKHHEVEEIITVIV